MCPGNSHPDNTRPSLGSNTNMKYDQTLTQKLLDLYAEGATVQDIALQFTVLANELVPERSIIAKLSSLGVYQKKQYLTKRGDVPVKKSAIIDRIAVLLDTNSEFLESLEKVNKAVLVLISSRLDPQSDPKPL